MGPKMNQDTRNMLEKKIPNKIFSYKCKYWVAHFPKNHLKPVWRVRDHSWFKGFKWKLLEGGRYPAPWIPLSIGARAKILEGPTCSDTVIIDELPGPGKDLTLGAHVMCHFEGSSKEKVIFVPPAHLK